ncbi:unnamed protein product [Mucor hiemalis]
MRQPGDLSRSKRPSIKTRKILKRKIMKWMISNKNEWISWLMLNEVKTSIVIAQRKMNFIAEIVAATTINEFEEKVETKTCVEDKEKTCRFINDICNIMAKIYTNRPSISLSESVYNTNTIFPCFEAMFAAIEKNENKPCFIPGEIELAAMTVQLKKMGSKADKKKYTRQMGLYA